MLLTLLSTAVLATLLVLAAVVDIRTLRIPNALNAAIGVTGLAFAWLGGRDVPGALLGVALGFIMLLSANLFYRTVRGRDGLGMGDAKLLAGAGAWIGWMGLPFAVLIASATGVIYVAALRLTGRKLERMDALAFGPFLALGVMIVWIALISA